METEPHIEAVVIDFSLGATTWFLQNPGEHVLISMYILTSFYPIHTPWEFNIKQAYLLFIERLVDLFIKQRESDLC